MKNERGFVLIEFVIALPLIIMLLYGLTETTLQIFRLAKSQAADYVLEVEAQDGLTRITQDARAAQSVAIKEVLNDIEQITIEYHATDDKYYDRDSKTNVKNDLIILDVIGTQIYTVTGSRKVHAKRHDTDVKLNPITGGNFFGDTSVTYLKFKKSDENVLSITLEMESLATHKRIKLSTAVFMPAYGIIPYE